jgi:hypothetical protein
MLLHTAVLHVCTEDVRNRCLTLAFANHSVYVLCIRCLYTNMTACSGVHSSVCELHLWHVQLDFSVSTNG